MSRQPYYPPQGQPQQPRQRQPPAVNGYSGQPTNIRGGHVASDRGGYNGYAQQPPDGYHDAYAGQTGYSDQQYAQNEYYDDPQYQQPYEEPYQDPYHQNGNGYPPQTYNQRPPPPQTSRSYQYDERFHNQGNQRAPQANGHGHGNERMRRSEDRHVPPKIHPEKRSQSRRK